MIDVIVATSSKQQVFDDQNLPIFNPFNRD
jgi:hypothetical protein